jgi:transcriptional regulator with XRE-family HTH domain
MSNQKERPPGRLTGRKYDSVAALMRGEGIASEVQEKVEQHALQTRLSLHLAKMRQAAGITQEEMGEALKVGQSAISKLEAGTDEHVLVHHVQEYSRVTGTRISLTFGKPISDMEAIVLYVDSLRERLVRLADSANQDEETEDKVKAFLGEASTNILKAVALCNCKLPVKQNDNVQEVRIEIVTGKKVMPSNNSTMVAKSTPRVPAV